MPVSTAAANRLLHEGLATLSAVETNGMRIDEPYLTKAMADSGVKITELTEELRKDEIYRVWQKNYGTKMNLNSRPQLADILFTKLKLKSRQTDDLEEGEVVAKLKADASILEGLSHVPFVRAYQRIQKLEKARGTFLLGIQKEIIDGFIYPNFNLHTTITYRSSADAPNSQNWPVRDPEMAELIRKCFISRWGDDGCISEVDFSGIEVRISPCYHHDPNMISYIKDPTKDMHRDMAAQLFKIDPKNVSKMARYCAKNMFVFPQFYGDYYLNNARSLWDACDRHSLCIGDMPMREHLEYVGLCEMGACRPKEKPAKGTFEYHVKEVQEDFWNNRFAVYGQWKKDWYEAYQKNCGFRTLTGFWIEGQFGRNDVINYPVQGVAFHCLLWSLIQIVKLLKKHGFKTVVIGQIHDSIILDGPQHEVEDVMHICKTVMTEKLLKHWKWICVPIEIEAEVAPPGMSWFHKKSFAI